MVYYNGLVWLYDNVLIVCGFVCYGDKMVVVNLLCVLFEVVVSFEMCLLELFCGFLCWCGELLIVYLVVCLL